MVRCSHCSSNVNCSHGSLFALFVQCELFALFVVRTSWLVRTVRCSYCSHDFACSLFALFAPNTSVRSSVDPGMDIQSNPLFSVKISVTNKLLTSIEMVKMSNFRNLFCMVAFDKLFSFEQSKLLTIKNI